jgi:hypothetical protein
VAAERQGQERSRLAATTAAEAVSQNGDSRGGGGGGRGTGPLEDDVDHRVIVAGGSGGNGFTPTYNGGNWNRAPYSADG